MIRSAFTVAAMMFTLALTATARGDWEVRYDTGLQAIVISSGLIQADETITVRIEGPPPGRKGLTFVVVEHAPTQEIQRFQLRTTLVNGRLTRNIQLLAFSGDADSDTFINETDIPCVADGREGDDYLQGGTRDDILYGSEGDDILIGGDGADDLYGGAGFDYLHGGNGADLLAPGDDQFEDQLVGGGGADRAEIYNYQVFTWFNLGGQSGDQTVFLQP